MEVSRYLDLFVDIGQAMLEAGAGIHRVEDTIYRLCGAYGKTQENHTRTPEGYMG